MYRAKLLTFVSTIALMITRPLVLADEPHVIVVDFEGDGDFSDIQKAIDAA